MCLLRSALVGARIRKRIHNEVGPISKHMGIFHMVGIECWVVSPSKSSQSFPDEEYDCILVLATEVEREGSGKIS